MRLIFVICLVLSYPTYSQVMDEPIRLWSSSNLIEWSDFLGRPDTIHHTFNGRKSKAVSATGIKFFSSESLGNKSCYELKSIFYCNESWKTATSEALLAHERGHFDLTEICARKLRRRLLELTELCKEVSLDAELDLALDCYDSISDEYDQQTFYGTNSTSQNIWSQKIANELLELNAYSDTVICSCN